MLSTAERVVVAVLMFVLGYVLGRRGVRVVSDLVGKFLLYIVIPYLMIYGVVYTNVGIIGSITVVVIVYVIISSVAAPVLNLRFIKDRREAAASTIASVFQNVSFLPIPLMMVLYGDPIPAALYSSIFNLATAPVIPTLASLGSGRNLSAREVIIKVVTFPFTIAAVIALIIKFPILHGAIPEVNYVLATVKDVLSELNLASLLIVGSSLALAKFTLAKSVLSVITWRLGASPLIHVLTLLALSSPLPPTWVAAVIIESLMPPATMNLVYARIYELKEDVVALAIAYLTPLSVLAAMATKLLIP